ncbi:MAG: hypothetical protein U1D55_14050 [Phycisphaerae bacterium]
MKRTYNNRRRATILLMVVTLLALLFVIVAGYLSLARFDRIAFNVSQEGAAIDRIVDSVNDVVRSRMRESLEDDFGNVLGGPNGAGATATGLTGTTIRKEFSPVEVPGQGGSAWVSPIEPVWDFGASTGSAPPPYDEMFKCGYAGASNFSGGNSRNIKFGQMAELDSLQASSAAYQTAMYLATNSVAREPFMDADGDGVPDSIFSAMTVLNDLANGIARGAVAVPGRVLNATSMNVTAAQIAAWSRYDTIRRYEVATRVVPHGGMVSVGAPVQNTNTTWNFAFLQGMFRQIKHPSDTTLTGLALTVGNDNLANALYSQASAVEPLLRRRGGTLASPGVNGSAFSGPGPSVARVPQALETLENTYGNTMRPTHGTAGPWVNRYNLSTMGVSGGGDWAIIRDSTAANQLNPASFTASNSTYDRRHLLTSISHSDDIALKLGGEPVGNGLGTYHSQLRFDLNQLSQAFSGADFATTAVFDGRGDEIGRRLACMYYDMLAAHQWPAFTNGPGRETQAWMLAANTLAFAAPRTTASTTLNPDTVVLRDPVTDTLFVGFSPQPFVTEVVAYTNDTGQRGMAIELYNPYDEDLDPTQFAVTVSPTQVSSPTPAPNSSFAPAAPNLGGVSLLARSWNVLEIADPNSKYSAPTVAGLSIPAAGGRAAVGLWRHSRSRAAVGGSAFFLVDWMWVDIQTAANSGELKWSEVCRDTRLDPNLAGGGLVTWSMVAYPNRTITTNTTQTPDTASAPYNLGASGPAVSSTSEQRPAAPLYLANAGAGRWNANPSTAGTAPSFRPASFPTPGFLLFVPRYAHVVPSMLPATPKTAGEYLDDDYRGHTGTPTTLVDFGHMPIFDSTQKSRSGTLLDGTGNNALLPWGTLVFDYFTTLNVFDPDLDGNTSDQLDPLRVAGRINLNNAPWFVLAKLPVLRPDWLSGAMSRSFRDFNQGVLIDGTWNSNTPAANSRFARAHAGMLPTASAGVPMQLGMAMATAIAAYRDEVQIAATGGPYAAYDNAQFRNAAGSPRQYRDETVYNAIRRGVGRGGLLTLGELVNVEGLDNTASLNQIGPTTTVVGQGDFMRSVALLALLDTHYLTTRSNTFTIYTSVMDRQDAQRSVYSQVTVDRSNTLPRVVMRDTNGDGVPDWPIPTDSGRRVLGNVVYTAVKSASGDLPQIIAQRQGGYFNLSFDD